MRLGIAGSGMIAEDCLKALPSAGGVRPVALCAREASRGRAEALARAHGVEAVVTDYDALLERADLDAVYVGLVNDLHYEYARRALEAGKHAIVEKPFTVTLAEAEALSALARARGLFLFEAVPSTYSPVWTALFGTSGARGAGGTRSLVDELGELGLVQAAYAQRSSRYDRYLALDAAPAFDPAHAGGALRDLNVYGIWFAVALLGRPDTVAYAARRGWNGVDLAGSALLGYVGGAKVGGAKVGGAKVGGAAAACSAAKDADGPSFAQAQGEAGWLRVDGSPGAFAEAELRLRGREPLRLSDDSGLPRLAHEWIAFERMIAGGDLGECYRRLDLSLDVMSALDRAGAGAYGPPAAPSPARP